MHQEWEGKIGLSEIDGLLPAVINPRTPTVRLLDEEQNMVCTDCGFFFGFVLVPMCFLEYCSSSFVLVLERIQGIAISALANCEHAMLCDSGIHDRVLLCIG